jgi:hypothetical protein
MIIYILYQNNKELERIKSYMLKVNIFKDNIIYFKSKKFKSGDFKCKDIFKLNYKLDEYQIEYLCLYNKKLNKNQKNHLVSIKAILEDSIKNNYDQIMILEYDIYFHKNFKNLYEKYKKLIDNNDIIHLGSSQHRWYDRITIDKIKIKKYNDLYYYNNTMSLGTFAIILKKNIYQTYLNFIDYFLYNKEYFYPSDVILSIISYNYKSIVLYPNLIICDISKSTILERNDYEKKIITFKWNMNNYIF